MANFIESISIKPSCITLNSRYESYLEVDKTSTLWTINDPEQSLDGPKGSARCVTIQAVKGLVKYEPFELEVIGASIAITSWYIPPETGPPARFIIQGRLGGRGWLFSSEEHEVKSPADSKFCVKKLHFEQAVYDLPFRVAGDITWAVKRTDIPNVPPVFFSQSTRLELCFVFNSKPPSGPWECVDGSKVTNPHFGNQYYIDLFRLFLPDQWELVDSFQDGRTMKDQVSWYLHRCVSVIWGMALDAPKEYPDRPLVQLNPILGQSFYLSPIPGVSQQLFQPQYGGMFNLRRWLSGFYRYCSSFDLAALVQLACVIVRDKDDMELLSSTWVTSFGNQSIAQTSWGYLNAGIFYGWPTFRECISPIFSSDAGPLKDTDEDRERSVPIPCHAWIEVKLPKSDAFTVIDITQAFGEPQKIQFIAGTHSRSEYLDLKMNQIWPDPSRLPLLKRKLKNSDGVIFRWE